MHAWRVVAVLLALLGVAACGDGPTPDPGPLPDGPPTWRRIEGERGADRARVAIAVHAPVRLRLVGEGFEDRDVTFVTRDVPAGRQLGLAWTVVEEKSGVRHTSVPPPSEEAAGRTEPHALVFRFGFEDQPDLIAPRQVWTRPGRGSVHLPAVPPPILPQTLPPRSTVELAAAVVIDGSPDHARIRTRDGRTEVRRTRDAGPEDRVRLVRLLLVVEAPEDGRSQEG
ncbi:MAG: hypothetical protein ACC662_11755 [Planctomycetota bacterium]